MCFSPLSWQTYDIALTAAKYEDGRKVKRARMTVRFNGVLVLDDQECPRHTSYPALREGEAPGPLYIQNHGWSKTPVQYRTIWVVENRCAHNPQRPRPSVPSR